MAKVDEEFRKILESLGATKEEAIAQAIKELSDREKVKMFSQIYPLEDETLACLLVIADRYYLSWLNSFLLEKLQLRVSLFRQGRREYVDMSIGERKPSGIFGFFGRRKKEKGVEG